MSRGVLRLVAALSGAALAAGGLVATIRPFSAAEARPSSQAQVSPQNALHLLPQVLSDSEPGAIVEIGKEGGFSVIGKLKPEAAAEADRAGVLAEAGPQSLTCVGDGAQLTCTVLPEAEVIPLLKRGVEIYQRGVHAGITEDVTKNRVPVLSSEELICEEPAADGTVACSKADATTPQIEPGESAFVTYRLLRVTFENGQIVGHVTGRATIPISRAAG